MRHASHLFATLVASGLLSVVPIAGAHAATAPPATGLVNPVTKAAPSGVTARGAALFDDRTGGTLWSRGANTERPIASITKVMTALMVIRAGHLDREITIERKWVDYVRSADFSSAGLKTGDTLTVRQLLIATLLPSGCDAAYALADIYGHGVTRFIAEMNATAASLGLSRTHFLTVDGTPTSSGYEGYSTPNDLIKLARAAMEDATFRSIVDRSSYSVSSGNGHHAYRWVNTNQLLNSYSGTIGIKTGTTSAAGDCLLFAARQGGRTLYGVVLNDATNSGRFRDAAKLLDWGFRRAQTVLRLVPLPAGANTD